MTETDATRRPLSMPEKFVPYLEKYRIYRVFQDMVEDLVVKLPKDHLKQMKIFLGRNLHSTKDIDRIMVLVSPDLKVDIKSLVKELIKDLGFIVISRRCVMDRYEKHDDYVAGCISPMLMSTVTKMMANKEPVAQAGWLMFDHPCSVREAKCLQQDGVFPTVTLALLPVPDVAPQTDNPLTPARNFFQQDFEGLKYAYKATLKEVLIEPNETIMNISAKCFNAIHACSSGLQGPKQGFHVLGAPSVYRVILLGPRGAGCRSQGLALSKHFGLIYLNFRALHAEAMRRNDDVGKRLRSFGLSTQLKADMIKRRIMKKDCIDQGWVMTGYPVSGSDFENLDNMTTPANRVIFLNVNWDVCKTRLMSTGMDWCTGQAAPPGSGPRMRLHPINSEDKIEAELDFYFTEALAELRAAAGITAVEIDANEAFDHVQVKLQAAVMAAPAFDIEICAQLRNVRGD